MSDLDRYVEIAVIAAQFACALSVWIVRERFRSDASWFLMFGSFVALAVNRMLHASGAGETMISLFGWLGVLIAVWLHLLANAKAGIAR